MSTLSDAPSGRNETKTVASNSALASRLGPLAVREASTSYRIEPPTGRFSARSKRTSVYVASYARSYDAWRRPSSEE